MELINKLIKSLKSIYQKIKLLLSKVSIKKIITILIGSVVTITAITAIAFKLKKQTEQNGGTIPAEVKQTIKHINNAEKEIDKQLNSLSKDKAEETEEKIKKEAEEQFYKTLTVVESLPIFRGVKKVESEIRKAYQTTSKFKFEPHNPSKIVTTINEKGKANKERQAAQKIKLLESLAKKAGITDPKMIKRMEEGNIDQFITRLNSQINKSENRRRENLERLNREEEQLNKNEIQRSKNRERNKEFNSLREEQKKKKRRSAV